MLPNDGAADVTPIGIDQLVVLVPRPDVEPGEVTLTVYDAKDETEFCSLDLDDGGVVEFLDWTETNAGTFSASEGTALLINLGAALEADHNYYVLADEGWLTIPEQGVRSKAITSKSIWTIRVGDFGIDFDAEQNEVSVGQTVKIPCILGVADKVKVSVSPKNAAKLEEDELSQDGDISITFEKRGDITINIEFKDAKGNVISGTDSLFRCR